MFMAEKFKKMHNMLASITESLRLYPTLPLNQGEVQEDDEFPDGIKVKKGMRIVMSMYAMGRMQIYGEKITWTLNRKDGSDMENSCLNLNASFQCHLVLGYETVWAKI